MALMLIAAVLAGGWLINVLMNPSPYQDRLEPTPQTIDQHFNQGLSYMLDKQYHLASVEWQQLLVLSNTMPEAYVNLGFSQFELGLYQAALDSFNQAMEINPYQANAYYGLAICFEKLGDIPAATGAIRSFIHLAKQDDPFVRKARSALWEWEALTTVPLSEQAPAESSELKNNPEQNLPLEKSAPIPSNEN